MVRLIFSIIIFVATCNSVLAQDFEYLICQKTSGRGPEKLLIYNADGGVRITNFLDKNSDSEAIERGYLYVPVRSSRKVFLCDIANSGMPRGACPAGNVSALRNALIPGSYVIGEWFDINVKNLNIVSGIVLDFPFEVRKNSEGKCKKIDKSEYDVLRRDWRGRSG